MKNNAKRELEIIVNECISEFLCKKLFVFTKQDHEFVKVTDDYCCSVSCFIEGDKYDQAILEIYASAGFKSLCDAWLLMPGSHNPNGLTDLGFGGYITELPPAEDLIYVLDSVSSTGDIKERVMCRLQKIVVPFFEEFQDRSHLVHVWQCEGHPLAKIQGREAQLASAILVSSGDKGAAENIINDRVHELLKARELHQQRAESRKRRAEIGNIDNEIEKCKKNIEYVRRY